MNNSTRSYLLNKKRLMWRVVLLPLLIVALFSIVLFARPVPANAVLSNGYPERMAIYYGNPAAVNGSTSTTQAAAVFDDYDMVIFGEGIEQDTSAYHATTQTIIQSITATTRAYGYLDLCVQNPNSSLYRCSNFPMSELQSRTLKWKNMGAKGIFLDQAGCDYVVSRDRQNQIVDYIHSQGMSAFINVWNQDDAFYPGSLPSPYAGFANCNPSNLATHLGSNDYTLLESWAVILSDWSENWTVDPNMLYPRGDKALGYKKQYGVKVATVNTVGYNNPPFNQQQFDYVWWTTFLYGFDSMAWGETWVFSSDTNALPWHPRPNPGNVGTAINPLTVSHSGNIHTRSTSAGYIRVDGSAHTGSFVFQGTPPPSYTPSKTPTATATPVQNVATQTGSATTDIVYGNAVFNGNSVTFTLRTNGAAWQYYHIYIDTDNNTSTGYKRPNTATGQTYTGIGADKLIENGYIYNWSGSNTAQTTWSWSAFTGNTATVSGAGTSQLTVSVTYAQIGYTAPTVINLLVEHLTTGYATLDYLYRNPAQVWRAPVTSSGPTNTPTKTNTPGGPTATKTNTPTNTPNVPTNTPTKTNTPGAATSTPLPGGWFQCANEGQTCSFTGTQQVRYGSDIYYSTRTITGSIVCNAANFGDPNPGITKSCQRNPTTGQVGPFTGIGFTQCAGEGGTCTFTGTKTVVFGNSGWFSKRTFTGSAACTTANFGDPLPGISKVCEFQ